MRKLLILAILATGLMIGGAKSFGGETKEKTGSSAIGESLTTATMKMSGMDGQVTAINGDMIEVRSEDGITRSLKITATSQEQNKGKLQNLSAETIKVGDTVYVQFTEQGRDVTIYKISESGSGTLMMDETGTEPSKTDFESESRSPGEGGQEDPTK